jgi:hypothetical protein
MDQRWSFPGVERINAGDVKQGETLCVKQRGRYAMGLTGFLPHLDKRASDRTVSFWLVSQCKSQIPGVQARPPGINNKTPTAGSGPGIVTAILFFAPQQPERIER